MFAIGLSLEVPIPVQKIELDFKDLCLKIKDKTIVSGVTGKIRSGQFTAIMGPSGAGKTTVLVKF